MRTLSVYPRLGSPKPPRARVAGRGLASLVVASVAVAALVMIAVLSAGEVDEDEGVVSGGMGCPFGESSAVRAALSC